MGVVDVNYLVRIMFRGATMVRSSTSPVTFTAKR